MNARVGQSHKKIIFNEQERTPLIDRNNERNMFNISSARDSSSQFFDGNEQKELQALKSWRSSISSSKFSSFLVQRDLL